ncbi:glycosyltransferase [Pedobacter sp. GR22-6]|uniref:glycosyltransferase n=1 Tax=Pedobacter sp. GR22-6 TaxID=3127957 RepID=UPI00307E3CF8
MDKKGKTTIVISGANITSGGPLQVFRDVLSQTRNHKEFYIVAIVADVSLFGEFDHVHFIQIKLYKKFILLKFFYEYIWYYFLSKKMNVHLWLSLNDCSPTVRSRVRSVYCHNATPFYKRRLKDYLNPTRSFLQSFYYPLFYYINLSRNKYIIVQQQWIRDYFVNAYGAMRSSVIVNQPTACENVNLKSEKPDVYTFIYPTKPQPYKNIEVICEAVQLIESASLAKFKVIVTVNGKESRYAMRLIEKYGHLRCISWVGAVNRDKMSYLYSTSDCLIFSSTLETWGLPITEFRQYGRPMLLVDLPYAKESSGGYEFVKFFAADDPEELQKYMLTLIEKEALAFDKNPSVEVEKPFTNGFDELFSLILTKE